MEKLLLLGDEAIAQAALDAGLSGVYAYPGTPSTEITEYIQASHKATSGQIHSHWSSNEKTAMEAALGMSFAGKRSMVCMKHVGVNVCADAFINAAITGVIGGLIVVAADDPSMHSSQNEQDSRFYGNFAMIPILEPSNQQEAYDMVYKAFDLSEAFGIPVMLRITTRLAHSRAGVACRPEKAQNTLHYSTNPKQFVLLPVNARINYNRLLASQEIFVKDSEGSSFNTFIKGKDTSKGIVASGIAYNYLMENFPDGCPYPIVKIGQYPLPVTLLNKLAKECNELIVIEEGYPLIEDSLRGLLGLGLTVHGRQDGFFPRAGELNPDIVGKAFGLSVIEQTIVPDVVKMRPPSLCTGCSHRDMFEALNVAYAEKGEASKIFGDIGCYTLGYLPPYRAMHTCVDMGASITMAKGAADAGLKYPIAVIGDSTFTHSGMTSLLDAINEQSPITVIISDNETTGMTGGQDSAGTGKLESICLGLGVSPAHLHVLVPLKKNHKEMVSIIREEMEYRGVSVIIPRRECIQTLTRKRKKQQ
ncbi:MAG: thiamine pyrophosphate-dependent enzyme [Bacteroidota bacterium]|nr:thiamine pyrophosphate-dependent enzyme [Bacteroidota bacterium]